MKVRLAKNIERQRLLQPRDMQDPSGFIPSTER